MPRSATHARRKCCNPFEGRYRYPFTNCTHCGPRLSIIAGVPYDRAQTTMGVFDLCEACLAEYRDPSNRRFHAEAIACHSCGPRASLVRFDGRPISFDQHSMLDDVDAACSLLQKGEIVAIKGLGGYQLACDATNAETVAPAAGEKRARCQALRADGARSGCHPPLLPRQRQGRSGAARAWKRRSCCCGPSGPDRLPDAVAPRLNTLGFMLPTTPLHLLMLRRMDRPVVMTSGNLADEPQVTARRAGHRTAWPHHALTRLLHDRDIANRVDDSVVREIGGKIRLIRRARGYAPAPVKLPPGFEDAPDILAMGGELKAAACLVKDGMAILTQHLGDLENAATYGDYRKAIELYSGLFDHSPKALVVDQHPEYLSVKLGRERSRGDDLPLSEGTASSCPYRRVPCRKRAAARCPAGARHRARWPRLRRRRHHLGRRIPACRLSVHYERLGCLKPVAMLGGEQAVREPGATSMRT